MRERFIEWNPQATTLAMVEKCMEIVEEYAEQNLRLTLRQLYYQFVSRDLLANTERNYKMLGKTLSNARLAGYIDWSAIEDRGRQPHKVSEFNNIDDLIDVALKSYRLPRLADQKLYVELWVEKDALAGVLEPIAEEYHVTMMVNKGYSSQSAMYASAQRIVREHKPAMILYLGDHDPSGEDMVRDVRDRLNLFVGGSSVQVFKVALTMAQIEKHNPPPNPTKLSDSRAADYIAKYGEECWEVDALDPRTLRTLITASLDAIIDKKKVQKVLKQEEKDKSRLRTFLKEQ